MPPPMDSTRSTLRRMSSFSVAGPSGAIVWATVSMARTPNSSAGPEQARQLRVRGLRNVQKRPAPLDTDEDAGRVVARHRIVVPPSASATGLAFDLEGVSLAARFQGPVAEGETVESRCHALGS